MNKPPKSSGSQPTAPHLKLGKKGEDFAARLLKKNGYRIIERNFRCRFGEIDIIARDKKTVVFVEIKVRSSGTLSPPYLAVNHAKRKKIQKTAQYYLNLKRGWDVERRFDIVSILFSPEPEAEILKGAF